MSKLRFKSPPRPAPGAPVPERPAPAPFRQGMTTTVTDGGVRVMYDDETTECNAEIGVALRTLDDEIARHEAKIVRLRAARDALVRYVRREVER